MDHLVPSRLQLSWVIWWVYSQTLTQIGDIQNYFLLNKLIIPLEGRHASTLSTEDKEGKPSEKREEKDQGTEGQTSFPKPGN